MEQVVINGSFYTVDFTLKVQKREPGLTPGRTDIIKLKQGAIKSLVINDNLLNYGVIGNVTFVNTFSVLDELGVSGCDNKNPVVFDVYLKCDDFKGLDPDFTECKLSLQLQDATDNTSDPIDKITTFTYDEVITSQLAHFNVEPAHAQTIQSMPDIQSALITTLNLSKAREDLLQQQPSVTDTIITTNTGTLPMPAGLIGNYDSYDTVAYKLYKLLYHPSHGPGIVKLRSKFGQRYFSTEFVGEITKQLIQNIDAKQPTKDLVTERFVVAPFDNNVATMRENIIEKYQVVRPAYSELFCKKWMNYVITQRSGLDITLAENGVLQYDDLRREFEQLICNNRKANLPARTDLGEYTLSYNTIQGEFPSLPADYNIVSIKNAVFKSFMYDNTTLCFTVPGGLYRTPGKFIIINNFTSQSDRDLNGLWFIVSVKHIFENNSFSNEILAVKYFSL